MACGIAEDFDENIVRLIERPPKKIIKSPRYQSIHKKRTIKEVARAKSSHKTFGPVTTPLNPPSEYLKKQSCKKPQRPRTKHVHYRPPDYIRQLPEWAPVARGAVVQSATCDFRLKNIEDAKKLCSKEPKQKIVDTRRGDARELKDSGLVLHHVYKKYFGQSPPYLKWIQSAPTANKKTGYSRAEYKSSEKPSYEKSTNIKSACRYIIEDDRARLLDDFRKKWLELMKRFQCLPFLIDTPPKVKRKTMLEEKLRQLEKDIQLIENHQYIYVYDD